MTEGRAIIVMGAAHLALLAGLSLTWSLQQSNFPSFNEAVPVEVVEISDLPRITEPPKPSIEAAPQELSEAAAPELSATDAAAAEPDQPTPQPVSPVPALEAKPEPQPKKAEATKADAKPKAVKKAERPAEAQDLANLIDKALPKARRKPVDTSDFAKSIEKSLPKGAKLDARATATLAQAIRAQLSPCWAPPLGGGEDVRNIQVVLRVRFAPDGTVRGRPEVLEINNVPPGRDDYVAAFRNAAIRTVLNPRCTPIQLPPEMYRGGWEEIDLGIDASLMT
jgi:hypothetical protein